MGTTRIFLIKETSKMEVTSRKKSEKISGRERGARPKSWAGQRRVGRVREGKFHAGPKHDQANA